MVAAADRCLRVLEHEHGTEVAVVENADQPVKARESLVGELVVGELLAECAQLAVQLEVVIPDLPHAQAQALAAAAHQVCPYSNATRGNIDVTITVSDD